MSLEINNLTKHQVALLETMWEIKEESDYHDWYQELDTETQQEVETLQTLIILDSMDQLLVDTTQAQQALEKFML